MQEQEGIARACTQLLPPPAPAITRCHPSPPPPPHALQIAEAKRLLRPGGLLCFVDINPSSSAGRSMPPAVATLMKATEPWTDEVGPALRWGATCAGLEETFWGPGIPAPCTPVCQPLSFLPHAVQYYFYQLEEAMAQVRLAGGGCMNLDLPLLECRSPASPLPTLTWKHTTQAGFKHVACQELDPRHRIVLGHV